MKPHVERNEPGHADSGGRVIVPFQTDEEMRLVMALLTGWQPIETAPKVHAQPILSTNRHGAVAIICWNDGAIFHEDPSKQGSERHWWSGAWDDGEREDGDTFEPFEPKVWMPIPPLSLDEVLS